MNPQETQVDTLLLCIGLVRTRLGIPTPEDEQSFDLLLADADPDTLKTYLLNLAALCAYAIESMPEVFSMLTGDDGEILPIDPETTSIFANSFLDGLSCGLIENAVDQAREAG